MVLSSAEHKRFSLISSILILGRGRWTLDSDVKAQAAESSRSLGAWRPSALGRHRHGWGPFLGFMVQPVSPEGVRQKLERERSGVGGSRRGLTGTVDIIELIRFFTLQEMGE